MRFDAWSLLIVLFWKFIAKSNIEYPICRRTWNTGIKKLLALVIHPKKMSNSNLLFVENLSKLERALRSQFEEMREEVRWVSLKSFGIMMMTLIAIKLLFYSHERVHSNTWIFFPHLIKIMTMNWGFWKYFSLNSMFFFLQLWGDLKEGTQNRKKWSVRYCRM